MHPLCSSFLKRCHQHVLEPGVSLRVTKFKIQKFQNLTLLSGRRRIILDCDLRELPETRNDFYTEKFPQWKFFIFQFNVGNGKRRRKYENVAD